MNRFDVAVLIGRFQPFHNGHAALLSKALETAPRIIVVLGSAFQSASAKNPFTWKERAAMIKSTLPEEVAERVRFIPIRNYYDDRRWANTVLDAIKAETQESSRIALIGYVKDASSYYLSLFPDWTFIECFKQGNIDATAIRQIYFETENEAAATALITGLVPASINQYLKKWRALFLFSALKEEHLAIRDYRKAWGTGPFVTLDAIVCANHHVLLIRRGTFPGKGLWALPGGFLEPHERLLQGAVRELREETGLGVSDSDLSIALKSITVFDHPDRSQRGRTITHAHYFDLPPLTHLPEISGMDDAAEAHWIPIDDLIEMEEMFFEDHFNILNHFLNATK